MSGPRTLPHLLRTVHAVLFDFDGPLCDVFAGYPAPEVAQDLKSIAKANYSTDDPLEVLRRSAGISPDVLFAIETALVSAELHAVATSRVVQDGVDALKRCISAGLRVGIVSNNSADAVQVFLDAHTIGYDVNPIIGRTFGHPELMKPNPWPLTQALNELDLLAHQVAFVGDSMTDIEAAETVNLPCIAYANKNGKREQFEKTGTVVIDSMRAIVDVLSGAR